MGTVRWRGLTLERRARELALVVDERTATLRERESQLAEQNARLEHQAGPAQGARSREDAVPSPTSRTSCELRSRWTIGPLQDLREHSNGDPKVERWLDIALRNSRRLLRLVKPDPGRGEARGWADASLASAAGPRALYPGNRCGICASCGAEGITLALDGPGTLGAVLDADAVEKIITNLLSKRDQVHA
jgi:hypothetical protein